MRTDEPLGSFFGPSTLIDLVRHRAVHQPDETAFAFLVDGETEQVHLTYRQLDEKAQAIAAYLLARDMAGQRALLLYPPGLDFITGFFGCIYAGVVAVPVYPPRKNRSAARLEAIANDAQANLVLTNTKAAGRILPLIDGAPGFRHFALLCTDQVEPDPQTPWQEPPVEGDSLALLQYTSGSTGMPKGVMLSHGNLLHNSALIAHAFEHTRSDIGVFWLPSYHDMGLIGGIVQPLFVGRPNILMTPMAFLQKPLRWLSAISRFGGTTSGGPNFAYDLCVRKIAPEDREQLDLSRWRVACNGAEPVHAETMDRFVEAFGPCGFRREAFYPCYGLAEATLIVSGGRAHRPPLVRGFDASALASGEALPDDEAKAEAKRLCSCGRNLPDQQIVIVDPEAGIPCPERQVGEIWVRGYSIAKGYWRKPQATRETFGARLKGSSQGPYLRTGDLGFLCDGELFMAGRIKDLIVLHGKNIYPQDIERTAEQSHPALHPHAGAAFTVERDTEERLVIVHELQRGRPADLEPVFDAIRLAVSAEQEMAVDAIVLIRYGSIPKTSSGKIQRHGCREAYLAGTLAVVGAWHAEAVEPEHASRRWRAQSVRIDSAKMATSSDAFESISQPAADVSSQRQDVASEQEPTKSRQGEPGSTLTPEQIGQRVLEQVRRVARERAKDLTLDTEITDIGLDSLERMEIVAGIEDQFGGRFPEEILDELLTGRDVVAAVREYMAPETRTETAKKPPIDFEVPEENYRFECLPEYVKLKQSLALLESTGMGNPFFTVHQAVTNDRTRIGGREFINFSSYNYVGMSGDPVVVDAAQKAIAKYGTSVSASRLVSGQKDIHVELERAIADFVGTQDAIVFVGGHATNETVIGHLLGPGDLILHDSLSHNSILQGAILSGARRRPFPHNDWRAADELLRQYRHEYRRVLLVIEGVYSMDGDMPELPRFIEVKKRHKTYLMIDEAHSIGTIGETGRGIGEHFHVDRQDVDIWMGTLSKAFGSCGGYIGGCRELVEYLRYTAPGFVYSVGLPPANAAAALASLKLLRAEPGRVATLNARSKLFLDLARQQGLDTGMSQDSPVVPVILGNSMLALQLSKALFGRGVNVQPIVYPAVPESAARLRFFITSLHTEEQIRHTVGAMVEELRNIRPPAFAPVGPHVDAASGSMQHR